MTDPEHIAERPGWDCRVCGRPWPCDPAREHLAATMNSIELALYVCAHAVDMAGGRPEMTPAELYERLIAWTRPGRMA